MATIKTDARTVKALLMLMQRAPMSEIEAVFIEDLFSAWFHMLNAQTQGAAPTPEALQGLASDNASIASALGAFMHGAPSGELETSEQSM